MNNPEKILEQKLDTVIELLRHLLAIELLKGGVPKAEIREQLKIGKSAVVKMLRSYKEEQSNERKSR